MSAHIRGDLAGLVDAADTNSTEGEQTTQPAADKPAAPATAKKTRSPRKKSETAPARTNAKTPAKTTAKKAPAKKAAAAKPAPEPLRVLAANAGDAQRVSLYLHPDDYEFLKYENRIELNKLMRTMIAVYRHNERFRATVDRAVKTAPRGGM